MTSLSSRPPPSPLSPFSLLFSSLLTSSCLLPLLPFSPLFPLPCSPSSSLPLFLPVCPVSPCGSLARCSVRFFLERRRVHACTPSWLWLIQVIFVITCSVGYRRCGGVLLGLPALRRSLRFSRRSFPRSSGSFPFFFFFTTRSVSVPICGWLRRPSCPLARLWLGVPLVFWRVILALSFHVFRLYCVFLFATTCFHGWFLFLRRRDPCCACVPVFHALPVGLIPSMREQLHLGGGNAWPRPLFLLRDY